MWMRWMVPAFIFNGLCVFGLRVLKEWGLRDQYRIKYLAFWYAGALALALIVWIAKRPKFRPVDIVVGCVLGFFSVCGQMSMLQALGSLDGSIVFPVAYAGGLFVPVTAGVLFFGERVGPAGKAGIVLGFLALLVLEIELPAKKEAAPPAIQTTQPATAAATRPL